MMGGQAKGRRRNKVVLDESVQQLVKQGRWREFKQKVKWVLTRSAFQGGLAVFLWLFFGAVFYRHYVGFTVSQAFYFAVQAGLSIGFGIFPLLTKEPEKIKIRGKETKPNQPFLIQVLRVSHAMKWPTTRTQTTPSMAVAFSPPSLS